MLNKVLISTLALLFLVTASFAQTPVDAPPATIPDSLKGWKAGGNFGANFSLVQLNNWAGGGQNAISIVGLLNIGATYKGDAIMWDNVLELGLGAANLGGIGFRKTDDKIIFISKLGYTLSPALSAAVLADFRTQFLDGLDFPRQDSSVRISSFMAPGYLTLSAGLDYHPVDYFSLFFAPLSNRLIFVADEKLSRAGAFGVRPGERVLSELGIALSAQFKKELVENITVQSRLTLFAPYSNLATIVTAWENLILLKVNKYVTVSLETQAFYDDKVKNIRRDDGTIGQATQVKNTLAVGLVYGF